MPLSIGDQLGPYKILAAIGAGGMGEVYRAHDSRLNRDVAIKVSSAQFTERFTREARAIAALNHTNICHLYDVGPDYLVMEYVEGPDLRGPLDLDDALPIIQQLIDGIEAAHEKNIIHRDLKLANIKITPQGVVKILDFGLAKAMEPPPPSGGNPENSPTLTIGATQAGAILGTAAYMAPEQAKGKQADKRSDIWSFGVILYEVLTGKKLFTGETAVEILGGVLNKDPDVSAAPPRVRELLRWCLEKDRKQRLASISDARRLLNRESDEARAIAPAAPSPSRLGRIAIAAAAVFALAAAGLGFGYYRATRPAELKPLVRLDVDLGTDVALRSLAGADTILSPDGTRLVYVSHEKLFTRRMDQPRAVELGGTEGAFAPFFSPDGQWVAFFAQSKIKKISVEGGAAFVLSNVTGSARGGSWGEDGSIIFALNSNSRLWRIPSSGGTPTPVTDLAQGEVAHRWPQILPGGKAVLFDSETSINGSGGNNIEVVTLADHRRKTLQRGGIFGRYLPGPNGSGHLIYVNNGTLFAVSFDLDKLEMLGTSSPILEGVNYSARAGWAQFDFSRNGTLVYRSGGASGDNLLTVQWLDAGGKMQPLLAKPGIYGRPSISPDGQRLALEVTDGPSEDIWVYDWRRDTMTRLTFTGSASAPVWTPDGRFIAFQIAERGMFATRSDGAGKPESLTQNIYQQYPQSFTPDGTRLALQDRERPEDPFHLRVVSVESDSSMLRAGKPEVLLQAQSDERTPVFSPDGHWLAYGSNESGTFQIYVRAFPDKGGKWQVSNGGGAYPMWSRTGKELFFETPENQMMVADYAVRGDSFAADKPRLWSEKKLAGIINVSRNVDLAPDGKRVIALMPVETPEAQQSQSHVIFLLNFFDELQRKVPVGK
jgi:serine/threonine-protein kinase